MTMVGEIIFDAIKEELDSLQRVATTRQTMPGLSQRNKYVHEGYIAGLIEARKAVRKILVPEDSA
jgi:hypothetical protein